MTELAIRPLAHGDLASLLSLYSDLHPSEAPVANERAEPIWEQIVRDPNHIYLGGLVGAELVAACNAAIVPNLTRGARPYAVIENVVTSAAHRHNGFGSKLMRALIEQCWSRDCYKIMLMSGAGRTEAHRFYEALGFDRTAKEAFVLSRRPG